jgi:ParB/RepB/Spo0J family partition protein
VIQTIEIPVEQIDVGKRRRKDFGDLSRLAAGIKKVGLLQPILVDQNSKSKHYRLVFGERRLQAVRLLGHKTIRAQLCKQITEEEFRIVELEENENRKALTEGERARTFPSSKRVLEKVHQAAEVISNAQLEKHSRGRPSKSGVSKAELAEAVGVSHAAITRAEQHVETAERFPWMQGGEWRQSHVLAVRESLEKLPESEHDSVAGVLGTARLMDPALAVSLVSKIAEKPPCERNEIYKLSQSESAQERSLALTKAAELPPMPDARIAHIASAEGALANAVKCSSEDAIGSRLRSIRSDLKQIRISLAKAPTERSQSIQ